MRLPDDERNVLDEEFPLGDGTAETSATVYCPYCNETVEIALDPGGGASQQYVEDCEVCCQPWNDLALERGERHRHVHAAHLARQRPRMRPRLELAAGEVGQRDRARSVALAALHSGSRIEYTARLSNRFHLST